MFASRPYPMLFFPRLRKKKLWEKPWVWATAVVLILHKALFCGRKTWSLYDVHSCVKLPYLQQNTFVRSYNIIFSLLDSLAVVNDFAYTYPRIFLWCQPHWYKAYHNQLHDEVHHRWNCRGISPSDRMLLHNSQILFLGLERERERW